MKHTTNRKVASEILIILCIVVIAYILTTLFGDDVFNGMDVIRVQGIRHYLHYNLFGGIEYGYFFKAIVILYCIRLAVWAIMTLTKKPQSNSPQNGI